MNNYLLRLKVEFFCSKMLFYKKLKYYLFILILILIAEIIINNIDYSNIEELIYDFRSSVRVNLHNYDYIINPEYKICNTGSEPILALFHVITNIENFQKRQAIRNLWSNDPRMRFVFMIGKSEYTFVNELVKLESKTYGDIVQENFLDTYENLTLKLIMSFKWVSKYCRNSVYSIKLDDDVVVNLNSLKNYLEKDKMLMAKQTVSCLLVNTPFVDRNENSKFYVQKSYYDKKLYPNYCSGPAYIYSTDLAHSFFKMSEYINYFKFEDVFFGMLMSSIKSINSTKINLNNIENRYFVIKRILSRNEIKYLNTSFLFYYHFDIKNLNLINNKLKKTR